MVKEGLIKSTCLDWRENFPPNEANFRRNTGCISRKFNEMGRKIFRQDGYGDLFRASLSLILAAVIDFIVYRDDFSYYEARPLMIIFTLAQIAVMAIIIIILKIAVPKIRK